LRQVARVSGGYGVFKCDLGWTIPACSDGHMGRADANTLFQEALSAGYVQMDAQGSWRWRHPLCVKYLGMNEDAGRE